MDIGQRCEDEKETFDEVRELPILSKEILCFGT